jgi:hypothetical protein
MEENGWREGRISEVQPGSLSAEASLAHVAPRLGILLKWLLGSFTAYHSIRSGAERNGCGYNNTMVDIL